MLGAYARLRAVTASEAVRRQVLDATEQASLREAVGLMEAWPVGSHVWGHYAEATAGGVAICRTENPSACNAVIAALVEGPLRAIAEDALGEPVEAFKDKVNFKRPGGAGFLPHQDRTAYPGVERVLSVLLAIDPCTTASGCLWLAGGVDTTLPVDDRGVVRDDVSARLVWEPAELDVGDAVCIDGLAPHKSDANRTDRARRVLVASYAPARERYHRDDYYAARARVMAEESVRDGRERISTLADFAGVQVAPPPFSASDRCTHG